MSTPGGLNTLLLASAAEAAAGYEIERSLRFNSADSYLNWTPASAGNRKTWTLSLWLKKTTFARGQIISNGNAGNDTGFSFEFFDDSLRTFDSASGSIVWRLRTSALFRDPSAWYAVQLTYDTTQATSTDRIKLYVNGSQITTFASASYPSQNYDGYWNGLVTGTTAYGIGGIPAPATKHIFNGYFADIHFVDGQALDPTSFGEFDDNGIWQPIEYTGTYPGNSFHLDFADNSSAAALGTDTSGNGNDWTPNNFSIGLGGGYPTDLSVSGGFKVAEPASRAFDSSLTTGATSITDAQTITWTPSNLVVAQSSLQVLMQDYNSGVATVNGINMSQGAAGPNGQDHYYNYTGSFPITITSITSKPNAQASRLYAILIDGVIVQNAATISAGNDSLVDVPTNGTETDTGVGGEVRGNYCTLNPLFKTGPGTPAYSNGNLDLSAGGSGDSYFAGTFLFSEGKYYYEATINAVGNGVLIGVCRESDSTSIGNIGTYRNTGVIYNLDNTTQTSGSTYTTDDVIGVAIDCDNGEVQFYKNGVGQGATPSFTFTAGTKLIVRGRSDDPGVSLSFNFGQRPFAYTAPSGFKALCTANLPSTTITTSGSYTGNGVADGPFVFLNGVPTAMTVDGNSVTFGTDADKLSNGFKIRTTSTTYNQNASTYNYTITSTGAPFKTARAQSN